jgi:hypothetical protein
VERNAFLRGGAARSFTNRCKHYLTPGFEEGIILERLLDSDFAFQTLSLCDPGDRYKGGLTDETLLQNFERKPLFQFHSGGTQYRSYRSCRPTLLTDYLTEVALGNS